MVQRESVAPGMSVCLAATCSVFGTAAAVAAAAVFQPVDLDAPDFRTLFEIIPAELAGEIGLELVADRDRW